MAKPHPGIRYDFSPLLQAFLPDGTYSRIVAFTLRLHCFQCGTPFLRRRSNLRQTQTEAHPSGRGIVFCSRQCRVSRRPAPNGLIVREKVELHRFCGHCHTKIVRRTTSALLGGKTVAGQKLLDLQHLDAIFCSFPCRSAYYSGDGRSKEWRATHSKLMLETWAKNKIDKTSLYRHCTQCSGKVSLNTTERWSRRSNDDVFCGSHCASTFGHANMTAAKETLRKARSTVTREKRTGTKFQSTWEESLAEALDGRGVQWAYEAKTFETPYGFYTVDFTVGDMHIDIKGKDGTLQAEKLAHLQQQGERICVIRSLTQREPDVQVAAKLVAEGRLPVGNVFL